MLPIATIAVSRVTSLASVRSLVVAAEEWEEGGTLATTAETRATCRAIARSLARRAEDVEGVG